MADNEKKPAATGQPQLKFFGPGTNDGNGKAIPSPQPDDIRSFLKRENPASPFHGYVGNDEAVIKLRNVLFKAHMDPCHCAGPDGLALIGPASTGKTDLAKRMVKGLATTILGKNKYDIRNYPFIECDRNVDNSNRLFSKMKEAFDQCNTPLVHQAGKPGTFYVAPPCEIYFDEAHVTSLDWLLKPTERKDGLLITGNAVVDCRNVLWVISTTHEGKLPRAFHTRFRKVYLYPYTQSQVAEIVHGQHDNLPPGICRIVAGYGSRIPREALSFAEEMLLHALFLGSDDYEQVCKEVGEMNGIDHEGINRRQLCVLVALYNNRDRYNKRTPMSLKRVADQCSLEEVDLTEYVLPPLQVCTSDHPPLIRTSTSGLELTNEGVAALVKRKLIRQIGPEAGKIEPSYQP